MRSINALGGGFIGGGSIAGGLFVVTAGIVGTGSAQVVTTGHNMANSMVWAKATSTTSNHHLADTVRGTGVKLFPNTTDAENSGAGVQVTAFSGNTVTYDSIPSGETWAVFSWLKQAGYLDIVLYTGDGTTNRAIAHALGVAPAMIWSHSRSSTSNWQVYHKSIANSVYLNLQNPASVNEYGSTAPNASNFYVTNNTNTNTHTKVAYLFAEKTGFSKAGSYTGNGGTNAITGLGFEPKAVLIKNTTNTAAWALVYNDGVSTNILTPSSTSAASSAAGVATLDSDGFTLIGNTGSLNDNTSNYIYMAWK